MLSLPLYGLLIGLPVYRQDGGRTLNLDIPSLGECLLLNLQPEAKYRSFPILKILLERIVDEHGWRGLLPVDVPVQLGSRDGVGGGAVGRDQVAHLVPGQGPRDGWALVRQIYD